MTNNFYSDQRTEAPTYVDMSTHNVDQSTHTNPQFLTQNHQSILQYARSKKSA